MKEIKGDLTLTVFDAIKDSAETKADSRMQIAIQICSVLWRQTAHQIAERLV